MFLQFCAADSQERVAGKATSSGNASLIPAFF